MLVDSPYVIKPGKRARLDRRETGWAFDDHLKETGKETVRKKAAAVLDENRAELAQAQDILYATASHAILVVLQAMDAGGKDGTIDHVFSGVNPQGCQVTSFKAPSHEELAHDYLWRIHKATPPKGMIGIFNRSHYESVLVERVRDIVPKKVWSKRYDHINHFEKLLADEGTVILKFYLHISKEEQKERLQARLDDPTKNWKFDVKDLEERRHWDAYTEAFEDALSKCSTEYAPWIVVPSDHKWFRNWVISDAIVQALEKLDMQYPPPQPGIKDLVVE